METGKKVNLFLVRHGETQGMKRCVRLNCTDPLSPTGIEQANYLAKRLRKFHFDYIYSSPTLRAKCTAEIIAKELPCTGIIESADLEERKEATSLIGVSTENMPWEYIKKNRLKRHWRYEDGESFDDIFNRANKVLTYMANHPNESRILVISHGSFTRALFAVVLMGKSLTPRQYYDMTEKLSISATALSELEYSKKKYEDESSWKIISWMDTAHLERGTF